MKSQTNLTELGAMENYRVAFGNVESNNQIAEAMADFGYDEPKISEGKQMFFDAELALRNTKKESSEALIAHDKFSMKMSELLKVYKLDRKKAKVVFVRDAPVLELLGINQVVPLKYVMVMRNIKWFYSQLIDNADVAQRLSVMKVDEARIKLAKGLIDEVEAARLDYMKEKGESQDATQIKNEALDKIDDWMSEFYTVANIVLEDNPQLLEALGKVVKS